MVEPHSHSRIEYMIKAKSQFKARSVANNVEIVIPVPRDVDSPSFKVFILLHVLLSIYLSIRAIGYVDSLTDLLIEWSMG